MLLAIEDYHRNIDYEFHDHEAAQLAPGSRWHHRHRGAGSSRKHHAYLEEASSATATAAPRPGSRRLETSGRPAGASHDPVEPCDDFYEHVCGAPGAGRKTAGSLAAALPSISYETQITAKMLNDLEEMFHVYKASNPYKEFPSMFINQAAFFLPNCTAGYSRNGLGWDPFQEVLDDIGMSNWPTDFPANASLSTLVAKVDAALAVFPFIEVTVRNEYENKHSIHLDVPKTILKRSQIWYTSSNLTDHVFQVANVLRALGVAKPMAESSAGELVRLEVQLENAISMQRFEPPPYRTRTVDKLPQHKNWEWKQYLSLVFKNYPMLDESQVSVETLAPDYLEDFAKILGRTTIPNLLMYVGYRVLVHLSPLLPDEVGYFVPLSSDGFVSGVPERLQGCARLLELIYPQGLRTFLRMSLGLPNSVLHYDTRYDQEVTSMFRGLNEILRNVVGHTTRYDPVERAIAAEKLKNMKFSFFGTVQNLTPIAEYYNLDVPAFRGTRLVESYYNILINSRRSYYHPVKRSRDWDNRFHVSSLRRVVEYVHGRNALFCPYSNVALANLTHSGSIRMLDIPIVGAPILRGLVEAIDERGSFVDHKLRVRSWWSRDTIRQHRRIRDCFWRQYKTALENLLKNDVDLIKTIEDDMADNAIVYPLYLYFMRKVKKSLPSGLSVMTQRWFFIQFARAHCSRAADPLYDQRLAFFGDTPPRLRVNIPLMNFPVFADAFNCQKGDVMYPESGRCSVWFTGG
ncbi:neprilysin-1-like [Ixodes scapularis]